MAKVMKNIPRIVVAGTNSGVGKTTIVAGLLAAFKDRGLKVQSFKVGPDYIDPGFHKIASGRDSYNLDTWLVPADEMLPFFANISADADLVLVEGVMGLYDGGKEGVSSTSEIAKYLEAPILLIIDSKAMAESAAAIAKGFKEYDPDIDFQGVILNRLGSANHERMILDAMKRIDIPVIGAIHRNDKMKSPERHLGLTPVTEFDPRESLQVIKEAVDREVNLDEMLRIANEAPLLSYQEERDVFEDKIAKIGVAYDEAFSFYYPASLEALEKAGSEIVYFSPMNDGVLPEVDGLFFGGGFPEMFLTELSKNEDMKKAVYAMAEAGMPIYAECGGLMYLCESICHFDGSVYNTCGVVPAKTIMREKLQRVGYVKAEALQDSILCSKGEMLRGHEFHFSTMEPSVGEDNFSWAFALEGGRIVKKYKGGYTSPQGNVVASYLHINFAGARNVARHFVEACASYRKKKPSLSQ